MIDPIIKYILENTYAKKILIDALAVDQEILEIKDYVSTKGIEAHINLYPNRNTYDTDQYFEELLLNFLNKNKNYELVILNGDKNWFTVYNGLNLLSQSELPIVIVCGTRKWGRRDSYIAPENIPLEYTKPYTKKEDNGQNVYISIYENNLKNGVLTAVEDFLRLENNKNTLFYSFDYKDGIGIIIPNKMKYKGVIDQIEKVSNLELSKEIMYYFDETTKGYIEESYKVNNYNQILVNENKIYKDQVEKLKEEIKKINEKYSDSNDKMLEISRKTSELNNKLTQTELMNKKLREKEELLNKALSTFEQLQFALTELKHSRTWKLAYALNKTKTLIFLKRKSKNPVDFMETTLKEWNNRRSKSAGNCTIKPNILLRNFFLYSILAIRKVPLSIILKNIRAYKKINRSYYFDRNYYLNNNIDLIDKKIDPLIHYIYFGGREGRNPSERFYSQFYLNKYIDVSKSGLNPLVHYVLYGVFENRAIKPENAMNSVDPVNFINYPRIGLITSDTKAIKSLVSIIMPTWNRKNVISRAIDSVVGQTYRNFELIIVDDGSTDGTEEYVKSKYKKYIETGAIKYFYKSQGGVSKARNFGLDKANGEIIAYLDSDNEWKLNYLESMMTVFREYNCNTAYCSMEVIDNVRNRRFRREQPYDRQRLLQGNYIDLNVFMHKRILVQQLGGFDENLRRLVDWDFILRLTKLNRPYFLNKVLATYYLDKGLNNISNTEDLELNRTKVQQSHRDEIVSSGLAPLRLAYVLWDFPALSQTFVINELRELVKREVDVVVYYKIEAKEKAVLDFKIKSHLIRDIEDLESQLIRDQRNMIHTHFAYPPCTLLTYPVALRLNIPFTFIVHAVDIFLYDNEKRNNIQEISNHKLCRKVFVISKFHRDYLVERGVPEEKIIITRQAVSADLLQMDFKDHLEARLNRKKRVISTIARFIEKKGIEYLIYAAKELPEYEFRLYGYGPLEPKYRDLVEKLGIVNMVFCGTIHGQDALVKALQETDIFVLPCIRASNGDMDGMPTVIFEAMSCYVPVVTTSVSGIPEYVLDEYNGFIVPPNSYEDIVRKIKYISSVSTNTLRGVLENARKFVGTVANTRRTVDLLIDVWKNNPIDIFMVTFNREGKYDNIEITKQIISRIYKFTTSPFTLTIVDNASDENFVEYLRQLMISKSNVRLIELNKNVFCGPASNIAIEHATNEYIIYVCSREGFVARYGWERELVNYMNENNDVAIAGDFGYSPSFYDGKSYMNQEWMKKARNKDYAENHPDREMCHVQGGIYILRKKAYVECGGFNMELPQDFMDVEYSYYLESKKWKLGRIENLASATLKTRPGIFAYLDENTLAAHPITKDNVDEFEFIMNTRGNRCNVCGWKGEFDNQGICHNCKSTRFDRLIFKYMAASNKLYRGLKCVMLSESDSLDSQFGKFFDYRRSVKSQKKQFILSIQQDDFKDIVIIDNDDSELISDKEISMIQYNLNPKGMLILSNKAYEKMKPFIFLENIERVSYHSKVLAFGSEQLLVLRNN
jgi:glycosyltransferase involved in cell wall biosynthesis